MCSRHVCLIIILFTTATIGCNQDKLVPLLHPDLASLPDNIEEEKNPYNYAFGKIQRYREARRKFDSDSGTNKVLHFNKNSEFSKLAEKLGNQFLCQCNNKSYFMDTVGGSGVGITTDQRYSYWATFAQFSFGQVGLTETEKLADNVQQSFLERVFTELINLSMDESTTKGDVIMKNIETASLPDPKMDFVCPNENFMLLRQKLSVCDTYAIIKLENEGLGVAIVYNTKKIVIVLLHYFPLLEIPEYSFKEREFMKSLSAISSNVERSPFYENTLHGVAKEILAKSKCADEISTNSSELPQFKLAIQRRYFLLYTSMRISPTDNVHTCLDKILKKIVSLSDVQDKEVLQTELRYDVSDSVLRDLDVDEENYILPVRMDPGIRQMLTCSNYGTGVEVSVKDDVISLLLVTFPSAEFFFADGYKELVKIRLQVLPVWELNLFRTAKLGCLARDVVASTQEAHLYNIPDENVGGFCINEYFTASFQYYSFGDVDVVDKVLVSSKVNEFVDIIANQKIIKGLSILPKLEDNRGAIPWNTVTSDEQVFTYVRNARSLADVVAITSDSTNGITIHVEIMKKALLVILAHGRDPDTGVWDTQVIERELTALEYIKPNLESSEIAEITPAIYFTKDEIMYRLMHGYMRTPAPPSILKERAQSLSSSLLSENLDRGIGFDQVGTDTFRTIFVKPGSVTGVSYSRYDDTHEDAMNINAVREVLDILCSGMLGINGPKKKALDDTPHYYTPNFPEGENDHVIMREFLHMTDLSNLLSASRHVEIGIARVVIPDENRPADTPTFYMVTFLFPHQRNLTGLIEGLNLQFVESSIRWYCLHLLASQLAASILKSEALKKEGFGTGNDCIVRYKKFKVKRDSAQTEEFKNCESTVKCYIPINPVVDFKFKFNERDAKQTFLPFEDDGQTSNPKITEESEQNQTAVGFAKETSTKGEELAVIVAVRLHSRKLEGDRLMYINELRRFAGGAEKLSENSPAAIALSIIGQSIAQSEFVNQLKQPKAFSHANELAAIFRRVQIQDNEPVNAALTLSDVMDELINIKNEDGTVKCRHAVDTLPNAFSLQEGTLISDQPNKIACLPIWKEHSVWDVLNITSSVTKEMGYWVDETKRGDGTIVVMILFYCPNPFATASTYKELEKFRNSNTKLPVAGFISPMLTYTAQALVQKIGFNLLAHPVVFNGGFGLGATFKATFHVWKDFGDARSPDLANQLASAFRTLLNPENVNIVIPKIFHSLTDFSWAAESDKPRTFTPASFGRTKGDLFHVKNAKITHFGIYLYQYDGHLIIAVLTPFTRNITIDNSIFGNVNKLRKESGIPLLSRTSSLAAVVDIFADDVAKKLPVGDKQFGLEGMGAGKDCLAYYKLVENTDDSTPEIHQSLLQEFAKDLLSNSGKMGQRYGIIRSLDYNVDLRGEWGGPSNDPIAELPMWRKRASSNWDTLPILSRRTREGGMGYFCKKTPDGSKTFLVLVFVLYVPSPYLEEKEHAENSTFNGLNMFLSSMLCCIAEEVGESLVHFSSLEEGIGIGTGFVAAFKRIQLPPASHFDNKAVEEMNKFMVETLTSTSSKKLLESIEIDPDFQIEGQKGITHETKHPEGYSEASSFPFIPISNEISISQIKRMAADSNAKALGLSVGINRTENQLMLVIVSPWTNKIPNVEACVQSINKSRLAGTEFKRGSPVSAALEFIATEIGIDEPKLSGYHHKGADLAWSIVNLEEIKSMRTPSVTNPIEYILSKKHELNCDNPAAPIGWKFPAESSSLSDNITFMDFIQSVWPTTKWAGIGGTAENLVVLYYTKVVDRKDNKPNALNGPYGATRDIFMQNVKRTACSNLGPHE